MRQLRKCTIPMSGEAFSLRINQGWEVKEIVQEQGDGRHFFMVMEVDDTTPEDVFQFDVFAECQPLPTEEWDRKMTKTHWYLGSYQRDGRLYGIYGNRGSIVGL